ncbi:hypothetical protein JW930_01760 [Candidatus Woesearchaeota archaeon]|nr:hypothetical protein [Candidatus Woesearchaeota archaeon]
MELVMKNLIVCFQELLIAKSLKVFIIRVHSMHNNNEYIEQLFLDQLIELNSWKYQLIKV